jgi:NADP-dependent 3-hydroxy acid dehydrogenase YdfG
MTLNGHHRTVLVTGASRGIGKAICHKLLEEGCNVIAVSRSINGLFAGVGGITTYPLDLSDIKQLPNELRRLHKQHPEITDLVCNAGVGRFGSIEEFSPEQIQGLIDLNLTAHILTAREFLPSLKARKGGNLVFMGSEAALAGGRKGAVYCATKFAIRGFSQSLREECAGSGVRVGLINPGMVKSDFFNQLEFRPGEAEENYILPEDIADAVWLMLTRRSGTHIDEINLSPQKKVIQFNKP